jgi:hypothetical protein
MKDKQLRITMVFLCPSCKLSNAMIWKYRCGAHDLSETFGDIY